MGSATSSYGYKLNPLYSAWGSVMTRDILYKVVPICYSIAAVFASTIVSPLLTVLAQSKFGNENRIRISAVKGLLHPLCYGVVVRALASHQCVPGSIPGTGVICGLSLLLVLFTASRGFSPGTPVFPSPKKPTLSNEFQMTLKQRIIFIIWK